MIHIYIYDIFGYINIPNHMIIHRYEKTCRIPSIYYRTYKYQCRMLQSLDVNIPLVMSTPDS